MLCILFCSSAGYAICLYYFFSGISYLLYAQITEVIWHSYADFENERITLWVLVNANGQLKSILYIIFVRIFFFRRILYEVVNIWCFFFQRYPHYMYKLFGSRRLYLFKSIVSSWTLVSGRGISRNLLAVASLVSFILFKNMILE